MAVRWDWKGKTVTVSNEPDTVGENTSTVTRLDTPEQYREEARSETTPSAPAPQAIGTRTLGTRTPADDRPSRRHSTEAEWEQDAERDAVKASGGDREAQERMDDYRAWKEDIYDRMSPHEQRRERFLQDQYADRQQRMDDFVEDHPGYRVDENGDLWIDDTTHEELRQYQRLERQRNRVGNRIGKAHQPYVPGANQRRMERR